MKVREIHCKGFTVSLQFNPKRLASTGAKVDDKSVRERKCFLCTDNLPKEQEGILYKDSFLILCNPAPIVRQHFTVSHMDHAPQVIERSFGTFLALAEDIAPEFTVLYNGARCGASAPDHMHFQAIPQGRLPAEQNADDKRRTVPKKKIGNVSFLVLPNYGRRVLIMESDDKEELGTLFARFLGSMKRETRSELEPMINPLCSYAKGTWRVIVFPRGKHRPDVYYKEGDERILVSPAAVDMGGLVITPVEKDFERTDERLIESIFEEVSMGHDVLERIIAGI